MKPEDREQRTEDRVAVVVAWHDEAQRERFRDGWKIPVDPSFVHFEQDSDRSGCARTKNRGIAAALEEGADVIIVVDDDCLPCDSPGKLGNLPHFIDAHLAALEPQPVEMYQFVTSPASRGTPYFNRTITMPVAASLGFWQNIGDYDAASQLVHGATHPMAFLRNPIYGRYFPFSGMNFAFRREWADVVQLVDLARWDDIFMGYIWQKIAYSRGYCFNLGGPDVVHSRQSNVWQNLRDEAKYIEANETLWQRIAEASTTDPNELRKLLPRPEGRPSPT